MKRYEVVQVSTTKRCDMVDVTSEVSEAVRRLDVGSGVVMVYSPHTTGAITVNEGADPDVCTDILAHLEKMVPHHGDFRHAEGNSDAHIKVSLVGPSEHIIVDEGALVLGTWQRVFFCEFDGPRTRRFFVAPMS